MTPEEKKLLSDLAPEIEKPCVKCNADNVCVRGK